MALEAIMAALGERIAALPELKTSGRRVVPWNQLGDQPAAFLRHTGGTVESKGPGLRLTKMGADLFVYAQGGRHPDETPESYLNDLKDALEPAFAPDNFALRTLTLGGLVHDCRIEGELVFAPGDAGAQSVVLVPLMIILPEILQPRA
jgi:hypothetical protein